MNSNKQTIGVVSTTMKRFLLQVNIVYLSILFIPIFIYLVIRNFDSPLTIAFRVPKCFGYTRKDE